MQIGRQSFNTMYICLLMIIITKLYAMYLFNESNIVFYSFLNLDFFDYCSINKQHVIFVMCMCLCLCMCSCDNFSEVVHAHICAGD